MSAATISSTEPVTVYVRLLEEAVDAWRPVEAIRISEATYRLSDAPIPEDETWSFQPGDTVVAELRDGALGSPRTLVAVARASDFDIRSQVAYSLAN